MPRCMPSVGFIATARTRFSPRCCSTSAMTSMAPPSVRSSETMRSGVVDLRQVSGLELDVDDGADHLDDLADRCLCSCCHAVVDRRVLDPLSLERLGSRHHFDDLARDRRLPHLVHVERQARESSPPSSSSPCPSPSSARRRTPRSTRAAPGTPAPRRSAAAAGRRSPAATARRGSRSRPRRRRPPRPRRPARIGSSWSTTTRCVITDLNSL